MSLSMRPSRSNAQPRPNGDASASAQRRAVFVSMAGATEDVRALEAVVRELVSSVPLRLEWARAMVIASRDVLAQRAPDAAVLARVWIDAEDRSNVRVYIADGAADRFLVRVLARGTDSDEVAREALAHVVSSAIDALHSGAAIGVVRDEAVQQVQAIARPEVAPALVPERAPGATVAPPRRSTDRLVALRVGAYWESALAGDRGRWFHGPGASASIVFRPGDSLRVSLSLRAQHRLSVAWSNDPAGAALDGFVIGLTTALERWIRTRVSIGGLVGFALEPNYVQPMVVAGSSVIGQPPFWMVFPTVRLGLQSAVRIVGGLHWSVIGGLDVDVTAARFVLQRDGREIVLLAPWPARPLVGTQLAWSWE